MELKISRFGSAFYAQAILVYVIFNLNVLNKVQWDWRNGTYESYFNFA
jgi:hypothetical protein